MTLFPNINSKIIHSSEISTYTGTSSTASEAQFIPMTSGEKIEVTNELKYDKDISDTQIEREKYIQKSPAHEHKVTSGDTLSKIARKYGVSLEALYAENPGFNKDTKLSLGQSVKIPASRKIVNVKNLTDVAKAMGISVDFVKQWKKIEDGPNFPENSFHNKAYYDNVARLPEYGSFDIIGHLDLVTKHSETHSFFDTEAKESDGSYRIPRRTGGVRHRFRCRL